jgi:hypothetical protein
MSNYNLEIAPSNVLSNGIVSFKNGNPVISFIIGEQDRLLIGRSLRLVGKFRVRKGVDDGAAGTDMACANDGLFASGRLGVYGAIDQVVIKSQQTHQVIEHIKHYNRFMSSYLPATTSICDSESHLAETSLVMPNYQLFKQSVLDNQAQATTGNSFCVPLICGLFNGVANIPLSSTWGLKGLLIEIHLAPDNNFLYAGRLQGPKVGGKDAPVTTGLTDASYEMSDIKLVCEVIDPSPEALQQYPASGGTFEYNSISSYFTSINSTNAIVNFNLGLKRVLGVFMNFVPSTRINNLGYNGLATNPLINDTFAPAEVQKVSFLRGGDKFPLQYDIDYLGKDGSATDTYQEWDSQVARNFINAFGKWASNDRMVTNSQNTYSVGNQATNTAYDHLEDIDGGQGFGIGMAYDVISDQGVDFSSQAWGLQLTANLNTNKPHGCYLFAHSKNVIAYNQTGLQVIS